MVFDAQTTDDVIIIVRVTFKNSSVFVSSFFRTKKF
jgi:hypothetical protein